MSTLKVNAISDAAGANGNAITLATDGTCTAKITNRSNRNLIINGAMNVAQRSTSANAPSSGYATLDRWKFQINNGTITTSQGSTAYTDVPYKEGHRNYLRLLNQSGVGAASNQYIQTDYHIEAQDIANSGWDYVNSNSKITLSFWVRSSIAQKFQGFLLSQDGTQYIHPFEISNNGSNLTANTWTKVTKTFGGNGSLTINNDTGSGMRVSFTPIYGTQFTDNSISLTDWTAISGGNYCQDMTTTWATTTNATFDITGVQLEVGSVATDFEHRSYGDELRRCQRYYFRVCGGEGGNETLGINGAVWQENNGNIYNVRYPVEMRTTPTLEIENGTEYWRIYSGNDLATNYSNGNGVVNNLTKKRGAEVYAYASANTGAVGRATFLRGNTTSSIWAYGAEL